MSVIIAIGGKEVGPILPDGGFNKIKHGNLHKEIITRTGKKHPKVLFIPTAKDDREDYIEGFKKYYSTLGCSQIDTLYLLRSKPLPGEIRSKILSADAIYVNGGNTSRMLATWKKYGVDKILKEAHRKGIVMSGHSAGGVCWFSYVCSDSFYRHEPFKLKAIGIINALVCPHYDTEPFRQEPLKKMMKNTPDVVGITLDEYAAIEVIDNKYRILTANSKAKAHRVYWDGSEYVVEEIEKMKEFRDLNQLLTKSNA